MWPALASVGTADHNGIRLLHLDHNREEIMSTRGLIGKATGDEGKFTARYHHSDSYPTGLGEYLVKLYRGHFNSNLNEMLEVLIDKHPAGWSCIVGSDFKLKPGYTMDRTKYPSFDMPEAERKKALASYYASADYRRPHCYCHGQRSEEPQEFDQDSDADAEWAYIFDTSTGENILHVLDRAQTTGSNKWHWAEVGRIELDSSEPIDWRVIECGENFERCGHVASYHGIESKLSMRTYLGYEPLEFRDAVAFIINGKRYEATGSGGDANFLNRARAEMAIRHGQSIPTKRFPRDTRVSTVKAGNGKRFETPVAVVKSTPEGQKFIPLPGVTWVYPATKDEPRETLVSLKQGELFSEVGSCDP
jgi:hypothetical protein